MTHHYTTSGRIDDVIERLDAVAHARGAECWSAPCMTSVLAKIVAKSGRTWFVEMRTEPVAGGGWETKRSFIEGYGVPPNFDAGTTEGEILEALAVALEEDAA